MPLRTKNILNNFKKIFANFALKLISSEIISNQKPPQTFQDLSSKIDVKILCNSVSLRKIFTKMIEWKTAKEYEDITYKKCNGVARIAFNRPEIRNAFRPKTTSELYDAFYDAYEDSSIGVVLLSGEGPSPKDGGWAFCSGGDQKARGYQGYVGEDGRHRLNILEVQRLIRFMPKVVIAVVPGWAVGGGHSLHVVCDLTLASEEHAIFKQTDADVTSFDGGYGSAYLAKMVGQKKAREIFFLGRNYSAQEAFEMGMVNKVVPHAELEDTAYEWAQEILAKSPTSIRMLKFAMNLTDDGMVGQQVFAGEATRLAYMTEEAKEGRNAFLEKRKPDFGENQWIS
jgi:naphthoate synthase